MTSRAESASVAICERLRYDPWPADDGARKEAADIIETLVEALEAAVAALTPEIADELGLTAALAKARGAQ